MKYNRKTKRLIVDPAEVDRLLVRELNLLTVGDRERVLDEVHGVRSVSHIPPSNDLVEEALVNMQHELDRYYNKSLNGPDPSTDLTSSSSDIDQRSNEAMSTNTIAQTNGNSFTGIITRSRSSKRRSSDSSLGMNDLSSFYSPTPPSLSDSYEAYREARSKDSGLISDVYFMKGFLIAENFNPKKAAIRLMKYLEFIRELFETPEVLFRPILLEDLHPKAKEQLVLGSYQMLQDRDSSGRRIFVYLRDICPDTVSNKHRTQVYMYFAQRKGIDPDEIINVTFLHNSTLFTGSDCNLTTFEETKRVHECMPSRFQAIHLCLPRHPFFKIVCSTIMLLTGRENRSRMRIHVGSPMECHYSLKTFGIPVNRLPIELELNTTHRKDNITYHTKWLRMQKAKESAIEKIHAELLERNFGANSNESSDDRNRDSDAQLGHCIANYDSKTIDKIAPDAISSKSGDNGDGSFNSKGNKAVDSQQVSWMKALHIFRSKYVECPRHEDCLFGRGRNTMKHPGNVAMRSLLEVKRERYVLAPHQKKSDIAWEVVNEIKAGGGRFLKELDTGLFTLVDDETARKKISIAFRDSKNLKNKQTQAIKEQHQQRKNGQHNFKRIDNPRDGKEFSKRQKFAHDDSSGDDSECFQRCL